MLVCVECYNSNSFTHGLLKAAEKFSKNSDKISIPTPWANTPGWDKPLPSFYFGVMS